MRESRMLKARLRGLLVVLAFALASGLVIREWSKSEEDHIRAQIDGFVAAFNEQDLGDCLGIFDRDYRDETERFVTRDVLRDVLRYTFFAQMQKTRQLSLRIEVPESSFKIVIDDADAERAEASVSFEGRLERKRSDGWELLWHLAIDARMRKQDGEWLLHRSKHRTLDGSRPRRF